MTNRLKLSICMIVRDEEKFLDSCLKSLKPLTDSGVAELIIVDTGSIDKTIDIAKKYTDKIYFKKWENNFSEARNYSISLAKGEYIFIMDADQDMEEKEVNKLIKLFSNEDYKKYNTYSLIYKNFTVEDLSLYTLFSLNLIFKNDGTFRYEGKVHNQPIYKEPVKNLDIYMNHYGYIMTKDIKEKKFNRTATLLKKELEKDPNNIYYRYQLSRSYEMHDDHKEAVIEVENYLKLIEKIDTNNNFVINYYHNAAIIFFNSNDFYKCKIYCEKMIEIDSELIDAYYLLSVCYLSEGDIDKTVDNMRMYFKYLKNFKYEKYSAESGLEIFSYDYKNKVLIEVIKLKLKLEQYEGLDKYLKEILNNNNNNILIFLNELITASVVTEDVNSINKIINISKETDEKEAVLYLLSKSIFRYKLRNSEKIINSIKDLDDNEKLILKNKVLLEEKNDVINLFDFIDESKANSKAIKVEYLANSLIKTMIKVDKKIILDSDKLNEILLIIQYLVIQANTLINGYNIEKKDMLDLFNKYISLKKESKNDYYDKEKKFINKIEEAYYHIEKKEYLKAINDLLIALKEENKFANIIEIIKNDIILEEKTNNYNSISKIDINKIKENLVFLINSNMFEEANDLLIELEKLFNIELDSDLISIKSTLEIYSNKIDKAKDILKEGIKVYKNNFDLLYNLAYIYELKNMKISAINLYYDILNLELNEEIKTDIIRNISKIKEEIEVI